MTAHSLLGASSAYRWLNCPGSFRLSETAPHRPSSIYAATGTLAHEMIEAAMKIGNTAIDPDALGQIVIIEGHDVTVDQDFVDGVNVMLEYLANIEADTLTTWMDVEFRVDLDKYFPTPPPVPVFGTVDAAALTGTTLEIVDYKNGSGITVTPKENPQLMFYGAGALLKVPRHVRVEKVKLTIVQPHASGVAPIRSWDLDVVDLLMWVDEVLVPGVMACAEPDPDLNAGSWCRFCPVVHACPELAAAAIRVAKMDFDDPTSIPMPADPDPPVNRALPTNPVALAYALEQAEKAALWISRLQEFAVDQLQHQIAIPGWGLVPTRPIRKWLLPEADVAHRLEVLGADQSEIYETRLRSPAQMEKALHRLPRRGRLIWDQAATMVEARSSGVKLGRVKSDASEDFNDDGDP